MRKNSQLFDLEGLTSGSGDDAIVRLRAEDFGDTETMPIGVDVVGMSPRPAILGSTDFDSVRAEGSKPDAPLFGNSDKHKLL